MKTNITLCTTLTLLGFSSIVSAMNITYPPDSGVFNVRDYGAVGDGITDDTEAIQRAISEGLYHHRVVYLPDGEYLVSDTLRWNNGDLGNGANGWGGFLQMQGQSRAGTILKLKEHCQGFRDPSAPKAVIATGSGGGHGSKGYTIGEGNEAFENHLRNFTVDTGANNPGAIGIDFQASNCGAMRYVTIRGNGYCGLSLARRDNGPGLVKDVAIEGFRFGVRAQQVICNFIFEDIRLSRQEEAGFWIRDAIFGIRKLASKNTVPALQISGLALVNIFDSALAGAGKGAEAHAAIEVSGGAPHVFVSRLATRGYAGSILHAGKVIQNERIDEWSSHDAMGSNGPNTRSQGLPVRDTPEFYEPDFTKWEDVGPPSGHDDTDRIQEALDSGKPTIFFRYGLYRISRTLVVPKSVKLIFGVGTSLDAASKFSDDAAMLRFAGATSQDQVTIIDRMTVGAHGGILADHADARTLVIRDILLFDGTAYRNRAGSGPLFVEDVTATLRIEHPTSVWARQLDIENLGNPKVINRGGTVWALGWKSETGEVLFENTNGGKLEIWAGFPYTFGVPAESPAFINNESDLTAAFAGMTYMSGDNPFFNILVRDIQGGVTKDYNRNTALPRGGAVSIPMFVSTKKPLGDRKMNWKTIPASDLASTSVDFTAPASGTVYSPPDFVDGSEAGSVAGNPARVGGRPLWRFDQVWPDKILETASYKPMVWGGQFWVAPDQKFGAATIKVENGNVTLGLRSAWGGSGDEAGDKLGAIAFIAPSTGNYRVSMTARAGIWHGDDGVSLQILKRSGNKILRLRTVQLPKDQDVEVELQGVELAYGDDLLITAGISAWYTGVNIDVKSLKVTYTADGTNIVVSSSTPSGALQQGRKLSIDGNTYTVALSEGRIVVLRQD